MANVDLRDAVTVVTGGASDIGFALAREAASRGARLMIVDVNDAAEAVEALRESGAEVESTQADVSEVADVRRVLDETIQRFGNVDVVCSNAGAAAFGPLDSVEPEDAARVIRVNVEGTFNMIHVFADQLRKSAAAGRPAYLMLTGSEHSLGVPPHVEPLSIYTATKYAVLGLARTASRDLSSSGVGASLLAPGWTLTDGVRAMIAADPKAQTTIAPYAQETAEVAAMAFDGLLAGRRVIATNPYSRDFALEQARDLIADIERLPVVGRPADL
ncbi:SDR family oxidoreductase [Nocardia sp. NPDC050713]|uniref:SDR family NAD(P)-dependent oxidoreductase n=1 Tax=Nocardia sp. NPDC050713 TaxID=3154511 RepID=UPI00340E274B